MIAKTASEIYNDLPITADDLDRYNRRDRLGDADWLESATSRCDKLINFYRERGRIFDFEETVKMYESITVDDAVQKSRGYFDGQMSIVSQGKDFDANLGKIWHDNFK